MGGGGAATAADDCGVCFLDKGSEEAGKDFVGCGIIFVGVGEAGARVDD